MEQIVKCKKCGEAAPGYFCGRCGAAMSTGKLGNSLTWPMFQRSWPLSLWMPIAWAIPFGSFLVRGWSISAIRRRALDDPDLLPRPEEMASLLSQGFFVFVFGILFFVIPLGIIGWLTSWSWALPIWNGIVILWNIFWHQGHENVGAYLLRNALRFLSDAAAPVVYLGLAAPLFLIGKLRYAITGNLNSFFRFFLNGRFCLRFIGDVLLYFFLAGVLRIAFVVLGITLLAVPLIGQLLPFLLGGAGIWMRSYWAGAIAHKMHLEYAHARTTAAA